MMDTGLQGRVALVTGANHGIGAAVAKGLAAEGAKLFLTYLRVRPQDTGWGEDVARGLSESAEALYAAMRAKSADHVVKSIRDAGGSAEAWETDLADPANIPLLFDRAESAFGAVDVLVNNAAHCEYPSRVLEANAASMDRHFAVNTRAVALMIQEYGRRHIERAARWGRIINVSTDAADAFGGSVWYGASKYAMESISRVAAKELGPYGVTVNVVSPGPVQTGGYGAEAVERESAACPMGRIGQPQDIADAVVLVASEQARWITGQLVYVGGGSRM
ncbi:MAG: SDR family oxidoreductase [Candidatus Brocadiae bacterium]|nr:SDR family oxidoreductase [Candidatus Brocadiia bacterium]